MQRVFAWSRQRSHVAGFVCLLILAGCPPEGEPVPGETRIFDGILFQWCPPGSFSMGSPDGELGHQENESPVHVVTLTEGFWLSKYEVNQWVWEYVLGDDPDLHYPDYPMVSRTWEEVRAFINTLNTKSSHVTYRLPTEAEWEYACRAGSTTRFYWGNDPSETKIDDHAWYEENVDLNTYPVGINPVGQKKPNAWGLHDMSGNVAELCRDWFSNYSTGLVIDPTGSSTGEAHVTRGGSWINPAAECRSARRTKQVPHGRSGHVGFRLVRTELQRSES